MAMFEVVGIKKAHCPDEDETRHIVEVDLSGSNERQRLEVGVVRLMLSSGDVIYTTSPTTKSQAEVTKGRCACGFKTLRSVRREVTDNDLTAVAVYS